MPCNRRPKFKFDFGKSSGKSVIADYFSTNDPDVKVDAERVESEAPVQATVTIAAEDVENVKSSLSTALAALPATKTTARSIIRKLRHAIRTA